MGFLGLSWFRTEKEKQLDKLQVEEQALKNKLLEKQLSRPSFVDQLNEEPVKLYKKVKLVEDVLTVILADGSVISKPSATDADFRAVREAKTEKALVDILLTKGPKLEPQDAANHQRAAESFDILLGTGDFNQRQGALYLNGINRSLPALLINKFAEVVEYDGEDAYEALKKFWMKCCLNPNAQSAEDLFTFLSRHQFKIDMHGNFYAYRRVVSKNTKDKGLVEFVSNTYSKVKAVWKKKPVDFFVHQDEDTGEFSISKEEFSSYHDLGNLESLYLDLPNMQEKTYTSAHTGKEDYRVGTVISMPRYNGDDNNSVSCSKGFHAASKAYDYSGFGNTPILVIINPMDVLAVPLNEVGKLRTCRWFFASVLDEEEQHILDEDDFDVSDLGDVFEEKCLENLEEYVKNGFTEEVKRHTFNISIISSREIQNIAGMLESMNRAISNRIVTFD